MLKILRHSLINPSKQNKQMTKAIVILGYSGVGKDTLAQSLIKAHPSMFQVVKFSGLAKEIVAEFFIEPIAKLEDKEWRVKVDSYYGFSPLDLLIVLYHGKSHVDSFAQACIHNAFRDAATFPDRISLFTDVRVQHELESVLQMYGEDNTFVISLNRSSVVYEKSSDNQLNKLMPKADKWFINRSVEFCTSEILKVLDIKEATTKPTLHLAVVDLFKKSSAMEFTNRSIFSLPMYEPLEKVQQVFKETLTALGLEPYLLPHLLSMYAQEIVTMEVLDITTNCHMYFSSDNHSRMVKVLREKAELKVHIPLQCSQRTLDEIHAIGFTQEEMS